MKRIGVVVNPIAGMGGRVGLKGTDSKVAEARSRGATPRAPERARVALEALGSHATELAITTAGGVMGEAAVSEALDPASPPTVVHEPEAQTTATDTRTAVREFLEQGVDLVLFVGGDGTAVDVAETITDAGSETPVLGVPAGVKIYSSVFAVTPREAGRIAATYDRTEQREVNDIDEQRYREGELSPALKAVVSVPVDEHVQSSKQPGGASVDSLAAGFVDDIEPGVTYVLGPGSTLSAIKRRLGIDGSPLGVDVWRASGTDEGTVLAYDAGESAILDALGVHNVVVVSPIGGQGFVFGRGNQQLSPEVIRHSAIAVVASTAKLDELGVLRVDTDDPELNNELRGWQKVRVGRFEHRLLEIM